MAALSWTTGSEGNSWPVASLYMARNLVTSLRRSLGLSSGSVLTPARFLASLRACSNRSPSMPITVLPNIWTKRRRASRAKRSSLVSFASPFVVSSSRPRFRTVSIMPGIENLAPERTLTRSGLFGSPNFLPVFLSRVFRATVVCSHIPGGNLPLFARYARQASVVMVKPGGTGIPALVISAAPAPLPPRRSRGSPCALRAAAVFFFQAEDGIRGALVTGVQTCALPISPVWFQLYPTTQWDVAEALVRRAERA